MPRAWKIANYMKQMLWTVVEIGVASEAKTQGGKNWAPGRV